LKLKLLNDRREWCSIRSAHRALYEHDGCEGYAYVKLEQSYKRSAELKIRYKVGLIVFDHHLLFYIISRVGFSHAPDWLAIIRFGRRDSVLIG
jgi:hypothetical protein